MPLTWPLEKTDDRITYNYHRHLPVLQHAQESYKRTILQHPSHAILATCIRIILPSCLTILQERTTRDEGIIKLVLYLFRNLSRINKSLGADEELSNEISRETLIFAFHQEGVLELFLTVASGIGSAFNSEDVLILDNMYHLIKGIGAEHIYEEEEQHIAKQKHELETLLKLEDGLRKTSAKSSTTRHNKFGTTVWLKRKVVSNWAS